MALKRRRKKKKPKLAVLKVICRYCAAFWEAPSKSEGKGKAAMIYRSCRPKEEDVTGDTEICEHFELSSNIHCEKFSNRVAHICCLARKKHGYADAFCQTKCRQVQIIITSYGIMGIDIPNPRRPDVSRINALETMLPPEPTTARGKLTNALKRRVTQQRRESSSKATVKKLTRRKSKPVVKKLKRRRR